MKALFGFGCVVLFCTACSSTRTHRDTADSIGTAPRRELSSIDNSLQDLNPESISLPDLRKRAFALCQGEFKMPATPSIPELDPPVDGNPSSVGLVYQEELAVLTDLALDKTTSERTYFIVRPRLAGNKIPMEVFVKGDDSKYQRKSWDGINLRFPSDAIHPAIDKDKIPPEGRVLSEVMIGHGTPERGYPFVFNLRSSAYVRFSPYSPQVAGASLRLAAHKLFAQGGAGETGVQEDFPIVRAVFMALNPDGRTSNLMVLVENKLLCGALSMDFEVIDDKAQGKTYGAKDGDSHADLTVDGYWYTREDFNWRRDPHTALVAYSSMAWRMKKDVGEGDDQAHDSDHLTIKYAGRKTVERYEINPPKKGLNINDFTAKKSKAKPIEWILANEDRDPKHYARFQPALGATNYNFRDSYKVTILDSNVKTGVSIYEFATENEYGDNLVAASTIRQNIKKAKTEKDFVHFKYRTTAFFP